jgi:hypothetical protein
MPSDESVAGKGESLSGSGYLDRHLGAVNEGRCLYQVMSAKTKATKTKTEPELKQETYNLSDLKHDLHSDCGFVELELQVGGDSASVS